MYDAVSEGERATAAEGRQRSEGASAAPQLQQHKEKRVDEGEQRNRKTRGEEQRKSESK